MVIPMILSAKFIVLYIANTSNINHRLYLIEGTTQLPLSHKNR